MDFGDLNPYIGDSNLLCCSWLVLHIPRWGIRIFVEGIQILLPSSTFCFWESNPFFMVIWIPLVLSPTSSLEDSNTWSWRFESTTLSKASGIEIWIYCMGDLNPFVRADLSKTFWNQDSNPFIWDSNLLAWADFLELFGIEIRILSLWNLNPSHGCWIFSTLNEAFALGDRFFYETLKNLISNNNTSVLVSSKSNKGSTKLK